MYGKCWTCPPGVGLWEELREHYHSYAHAFVFTTVHPLEDSYDIEGMTKGRKQHTDAERAIEKLLVAEAEPFAICGAEGCSLCEKCTYPNAPCRHPELAHHSDRRDRHRNGGQAKEHRDEDCDEECQGQIGRDGLKHHPRCIPEKAGGGDHAH